MQSACVDTQARVVSRWAGSDSPGRLICNQPCPGSSPGTGFQRLTTIHCPICTDNHSPYQLENHSYIAGMHNDGARCQGIGGVSDRIAIARVKSRSHISIHHSVTLPIKAEQAHAQRIACTAGRYLDPPMHSLTPQGVRPVTASLCENSSFDALVSLNKPGGHAPLGENCSLRERVPSGGIGRRMLSCGEDQTPAKATIQHNWRGVWSCGVQIPASAPKDNHAASCALAVGARERRTDTSFWRGVAQNNAPVAQPDRAAVFYSAGCRFESCRGCQSSRGGVAQLPSPTKIPAPFSRQLLTVER